MSNKSGFGGDRYEKLKNKSSLFYIASFFFYIASIIGFVSGNSNSMAIVWLGLGKR